MFWRRELLFLLLSATLAAATVHDVQKRSRQSLQDVLDTLNLGLQRLDIAILGLPNGTAPQLAVLAAQALPIVQNATLAVQASQPLGIQDSKSLLLACSTLRTNANLTVLDSVRQKPLFDALNITATFQQGLVVQNEAVQQFVVVFNSKMAPGAQDVVSILREIGDIFFRGVAAFSDPALAATLGPAPILTTPINE